MGFAYLLASSLLHFGNVASFVLILGFISTRSQEAPDFDNSNDIIKLQVNSEPVILKDLGVAEMDVN